MIQKHRIRANNTSSVNSVNRDNKVVVELQQSTKPYFFTNSIREQIDQYEVFQEEREKCTRFRLITTIKPYCTNILFNTVTEIVKYEDDGTPIIVDDESSITISSSLVEGKNVDLNRIDMIRNTEYSKEDVGFEYHPGYDIFNNHLLRNKTFKIVNPRVNSRSVKDDFNTIYDLARRFDGEEINFTNRKNIDIVIDETQKINKHLYDREDLYDVNDAINAFLTEENGWLGFVNKSTIISKKRINGEWIDQDFNHIINDKESCDFVDMYPDRTLFSFNPKYNPYLHRPEYNWKFYLTYPYKNFYDHELLKDKNGDKCINAVLLQGAEYVTGINGEDIILFKTYIKHNLVGGSTIKLYYKEEGSDEYEVFEDIVVSGIGDLEKNNEDFYFYITASTVLDYLTLIEEKGKIEKYTFRFVNVVNGYDSEYYIRLFRKLPNLSRSRAITEEDLETKQSLDNFIDECEKEFDKEVYRLGFSNTIYNDNNTQVTFTDTIDIENILDNRGRPITDIFFTIVKNNKGNDLWYKGNVNEPKDIEYSHCFSEVSHGFELFCDEDVDIIRHAQLSNIRMMHSHLDKNNDEDLIVKDDIYYDRKTETDRYGWGNFYPFIEDEEDDEESDLVKDTEKTDSDGNKIDVLFVGDIVEYNPTVCREDVLSEGKMRFNTYLRDNPDKVKYDYVIDVMKQDDYDANDFFVEPVTTVEKSELFHPEGYYYKAHYPIMLRENGELNQDSHYDVKVRNVSKVNIGNKICMVVKTMIPHNIGMDDYLLICEDGKDKIMSIKPLYIFDELTFAIGDYTVYNKDTNSYEVVMTAEDISDTLNGMYENIVLKLRRYNNNIPFYATKTPGKNRYMWRDINNVGNKNNVYLEEYPFTNGCYYINQDINFYLKRQDPFDEIGMYYYGDKMSTVPNDVIGNINNESDYEYKDESKATC